MVCQHGWLLKIDFLIHIALWLNDLILIHETQRSIFKDKPSPVDAASKWTLDKSDYIFHHWVNLWRLTATLASKCLYPNSRGIKNFDEGLYCFIYWRAAFFLSAVCLFRSFTFFEGHSGAPNELWNQHPFVQQNMWAPTGILCCIHVQPVNSEVSIWMGIKLFQTGFHFFYINKHMLLLVSLILLFFHHSMFCWIWRGALDAEI